MVPLAMWSSPVLLAAMLRIIGLTREPVWLDEILTDRFTSGGFDLVFRSVARDLHPPLYFLGVSIWRRLFHVAGAELRGYGIVWSAIAVGALVLLMRELGAGRRVALGAGFLLALSPLDIYYAQEARPYVQAAALAALSTWLLVAWWRRRGGARAWRWLLAYALTAAAMILTHYAAATIALAQGIAVVVLTARRTDSGGLVAFLGASFVVVAVLAPWLVFVHRVHAGVELSRQLAWMPVPTAADVWRLFAVQLSLGLVPVARPQRIVIAVGVSALIVALAVVAWSRRQERRDGDLPAPVLLAWLAVAPVVMAFAVSRLWAVILFPPRFAELVLPFATGWVALAVFRIRPRTVAVGLIAALAAGLVWADALQLERPQKSGMTGFARLWCEQGPPDAVYFFPRWVRLEAEYYLGRPIRTTSVKELRRKLRGNRPLKIWVCRITDGWYHMSSDESSVYKAVLDLGREHVVRLVDDIRIVELSATPSRPSYPLLAPGRGVEAGSHDADPFLWSGWWKPEGSFRWSRGKRSVIVFGLGDPRDVATLEMEGFCYGVQPLKVVLNGRVLAEYRCSGRRPRRWLWQVPPGILGSENTLVFEHPEAISPAARNRGHDRRKLAVGLISFQVR